MSALERLLVPGFTELPACRCGKDMHTARINLLPERTDTHIRIGATSKRHRRHCEGSKEVPRIVRVRP